MSKDKDGTGWMDNILFKILGLGPKAIVAKTLAEKIADYAGLSGWSRSAFMATFGNAMAALGYSKGLFLSYRASQYYLGTAEFYGLHLAAAAVAAYTLSFVWWGAKKLPSYRKAVDFVRNRMSPKTTPQRDKDGVLLVGDGDFPFPRLLYTAMTLGEKLEDARVDNTLAGKPTSKWDAMMFKFLFVPVDSRTISAAKKKEYVKKLETMGYSSPAKIGVILRRVSEYDIRERPDIVKKAAEFPGAAANASWYKKYTKLRGI